MPRFLFKSSRNRRDKRDTHTYIYISMHLYSYDNPIYKYIYRYTGILKKYHNVDRSFVSHVCKEKNILSEGSSITGGREAWD